jgi:hypothetical protein
MKVMITGSTDTVGLFVESVRTRRMKMKYIVTINKSYTVASFAFDTLMEASGFAQKAADHIEADGDGKRFSVCMELIPEDKDEQL